MDAQQQENTNCFDHNVVENQKTDPSYLTQGQKQQHCEQATDLPINKGIDEPHGSTASPFSHNELLQQALGEMDEIANVGNAEWGRQLGENTPQEEAELQVELGNCNTVASLLNYFCPI